MNSTIFIYGILPIIGGIVLYYVINVIVRIPGYNLSKKFNKLGDLTSYTYQEIENEVGYPQSVSYQTNNEQRITVRQWIKSNYHIVLLFDENESCLGISHQASV